MTTPGRRGLSRGQVWILAVGLLLGASFLVVFASGGFEPASTSPPGPIGSASLGPAISGAPAGGELPASPVTGVVTDIEATGLTSVAAITLRTADGVQTVFRIGLLENGAEFPPGHLSEHMATSSPVRVFFREEGGEMVVYRLEDGS